MAILGNYSRDCVQAFRSPLYPYAPLARTLAIVAPNEQRRKIIYCRFAPQILRCLRYT